MAQITNRVGYIPLTKQQLDKNFENLDRYKLTKNSNSVIIPSGTTAQRDGSINVGRLRFNTDINEFEGFYNTGWNTVGAKGYSGSGGPVTVGVRGSVGERGFTGSRGNTGNIGNTGTSPTGATGLNSTTAGNRGAIGTPNPGPTGPQGISGVAGGTGVRGATGSYPSNIIRYSVTTTGVSNNVDLSFFGTTDRPGYNNTSSGIQFKTDGTICVSRTQTLTNDPYYDGVISIGASTAGELVRYTYKGDNSNLLITTMLNNSGWNLYTFPYGSATLVLNNAYSDYRKKENFDLNVNNLQYLKKIKLYEYNYKKGYNKHFGFIAHQLQEHWPNAVIGKKDDPDIMQNVSLLSLDGLLFSSVKELDNKLNNIIKKIKEKYDYNI